MFFTLDRFEENFAVMISDDGKTLDLARERFADFKEGDVFREDFIFDKSETDRRRASNRALFEKLRRNKKC